jgi:uncharacterized protein
MQIAISKIIVYPVKSCQGIELKSSPLIDTGLKYDRNWAIVQELDGKWTVMTQRKYPRMTFIYPIVVETSASGDSTPKMLRLTIEGKTCDVPVARQGKLLNASVWDDTVSGIDQGDTASAFLSSFLGVPCRLIYKNSAVVRTLMAEHTPSTLLFNYTPQTGFADAFPMLILSEESLADIQLKSPVPVSPNTFRPNIILNGCTPYQEESWVKIKIGKISVFINCRCSKSV